MASVCEESKELDDAPWRSIQVSEAGRAKEQQISPTTQTL
jgi:hypothetical protein